MRIPIFNKLLFWFLIVGIIPLFAISGIYYFVATKFTKSQIEERLIREAEEKIVAVRGFYKKGLDTAVHISEMQDVVRILEAADTRSKNNAPPDFEKNAVMNQKLLKNYAQTHPCYDILIVSKEGTVVCSMLMESDLGSNLFSGKKHPDGLSLSVQRAKSTGRAAVSELFMYDPSKKHSLFFAAPVHEGEEIKGFVVMQYAENELRTLASDYAGLGKTGEVVMAIKQGEEVHFISSLRNEPGVEFKKTLRIGSPVGLPIQQAVTGRNGFGLSVDYRGKKVLAKWEYIPELKWGIVVKIDRDEVFGPIADLTLTFFIVLILVAAVSVLVSIVIAAGIIEPIKILGQSMEGLEKGDLAARARVVSMDEIGELAGSFNKMAETIQASSIRLKYAIGEVKRTNYELEQFAYVASHDLQEPLRAVAGYIRILEKKYGTSLDDTARGYINSAIKGAERMRSLINDLLNFSRVSTGKEDLKTVDLNEAVNAAIAGIKLLVEETGTKIEIQKLPAVTGDFSLLVQLFVNLLTNAIKFRRADLAPVITISANPENEHVVISVKDNGIGIDPRYFDRIFVIFQRLNSTASYQGNGIGLALCKRIVQRHRGKIWLESEEGKGADFKFTLKKAYGEV